MNKTNMVLVPQSDIDRLEKARLSIHKLASDRHILQDMYIYGITEPMWNITHKKYKIVEIYKDMVALL